MSWWGLLDGRFRVGDRAIFLRRVHLAGDKPGGESKLVPGSGERNPCEGHNSYENSCIIKSHGLEDVS